MQIKDMFEKQIDRDIQGVIKVGQSDGENIKQELEEYVVTRELEEHFRDFFNSYKKGITGYTDKMGVWISGFFGSGKSHFLKILSYLLENREVGNKKAIDYFIDDKKIKDKKILENMKLATSVSTDVILFNIDSKSKSSGTKGKDSILNVFLRVFNEMQNFSTDPHLADLERILSEEGLYEMFKESYRKRHNLDWIDNRHKFKFHKSKVVESLMDIGYMSEDSAKDWVKTTTRPYEISIERFSEMVKEYLDKKEENHHIVFLVDEIGQYIGADTDLMLNLQTITEDLGIKCGGKAWVVVTSQQDIDSITKVIGEDFSKIQGRFDTRLNLTSANVDEVIKLRILEKNQIAKETLSILYENNETVIKNLIIFNDGIEKKLYENNVDFYEIYPFIPYQFNMLASVLTSIRQHGASGKHLSEGERSMLALFKESAEQIADKEDGIIIPFHSFYNGLEKFLDHSHSAVIKKALDNEKINPELDEDNFNVNVLKTLFLIKYVKEIEANLENVTSLMVSNINQDRIELKDSVERALRVLVSQTLVQKNGEIYIFLTNEEQEINREIERQNVETGHISKKIGDIIYTEILGENKVEYKRTGNQYIFLYNRFIDGEHYGSNRGYNIGVDIITRYSGKNNNSVELKMASARDTRVYVDLPQNDDYIEEIKSAMQIERYLNISKTSSIPKLQEIESLKKIELKEHSERGKEYLKDALKDSEIYLNGDKIELSNGGFKDNIEKALKELIEIVYHKIDYIDAPMSQKDILELFKKTNIIKLEEQEEANKNAIRDLLEYIRIRTRNNSNISIKEIKDRFKESPYGFLDSDIEWLVAKLFVDGKISFTLNGESISLINTNYEEIINYILKRQYVEKLLIAEKEVIEDRYVRAIKNIFSELFNKPILFEDTDKMIKKFKEESECLIGEINILLKYYEDKYYPAKEVLDEGNELLSSIENIKNTKLIFKKIEDLEKDYLDFKEEYEPVKTFFEGNQVKIWDKTRDYISIYEESKSYILNAEVEAIVEEMGRILKMVNPYGRIKDLPSLNDRFMNLYNNLLDRELEPVKHQIGLDRDRILDELEKTKLEDKFRSSYNMQFNNLLNRAKDCNNVAKINGFKIESETLKLRYLKEIELELERELERKKEQRSIEAQQGIEHEPEVDRVIRRKNISIKDLGMSNSWQIKTDKDLENYILDLKEKLKKEMEEDTILNIEF